MKKKNRIFVCILLILCSCTKFSQNTVFQYSTIDALLAGVYDGSMTLYQLKKEGNFGIGTFNALDGEMVMLNGRVYQVKADGKVYTPELETKTPFATVCKFKGNEGSSIQLGTTFKSFEKLINSEYENKNIFYAIRIKGIFKTIRTRSVPRQKKPYPLLHVVTRNQPEFVMENISGTIVGFRCPDYVKGINVPGYHLHFISDDQSFGGHILEFVVSDARYRIDMLHRFTLVLPAMADGFGAANLSKDRSDEMKQVEKE